MTSCIKRVAKEVLGASKGFGLPTKETCCQNEEFQGFKQQLNVRERERERGLRGQIYIYINLLKQWK